MLSGKTDLTDTDREAWNRRNIVRKLPTVRSNILPLSEMRGKKIT